MKKRTLLIVLIIVAVAMVIPLSVFAATSNAPAAKAVRGFFGIDASKLTDTQKADISDYSAKMADLQKQFINKMVADGVLTKEQGDAASKKVDESLKASQEKGVPFNTDILDGRAAGKAGGFRMGPGSKGIDTSKLTNDQKTELDGITASIVAAEKQVVSKQVEYGLLTKEQGDSVSAKLDAMAKAGQENILGIALDGGFMPGMQIKGGIDTSKLTDDQKTQLDALKKNVTDLQKKMVNTLVTDGVLTSDQGTKLTNGLDNGAAAMAPGFKQRMGRSRNFNNPTGNNTNTQTDTQTDKM